MSKNSRLNIIKKIERKRKSKVIVYITGDRRGLESRIATDIFPFVLEHLEYIGDVKKIDLFLYTVGGITIAGTGLVALIREYCENFSVLIPFKAHSAGTLIALGADSIVMNKVTQLSPVDPSVQSPYGQQIPGQQSVPVSVEDVIGYLDLAREEANIKDDNAMSNVFKELSSKVHPLTLGSVFRARNQIVMLATQLLMRHMGEEQSAKVKKIVGRLTRELYSHDYIIGRKEAKDILGLNVEDADEDLTKWIWQLYKEYEVLLELNTPLAPALLLGDREEGSFIFNRAIIESIFRTDAFQTSQTFKKVQVNQPGIPQPVTSYQGNIMFEQWKTGVDI